MLWCFMFYYLKCSTVCARSLDPFYIVTDCLNWVKTSWTYSTFKKEIYEHCFFMFRLHCRCFSHWMTFANFSCNFFGGFLCCKIKYRNEVILRTMWYSNLNELMLNLLWFNPTSDGLFFIPLSMVWGGGECVRLFLS